MRVGLVAALLLVAGLAGCASSGTQGPDEVPPAGIELDAFPPEDSSQGLELLETLSTRRGDLNTAPYNLAMGESLLVAAVGSVIGALGPPMEAVVFDVRDPLAPTLLSRIALPGGGVEAVAITPDDRYAFIGTEFTGATGIFVIDLDDPADPQIHSFTPMEPEGPHNVRYAEVDGQALVFASVSHVSTVPNAFGAPQDTNPVHDLRVDWFAFDPASRAPMPRVGSYQAPGSAGMPTWTPIVHDAIHETHPITGQDILYVANWDAGTRFVDVSDPARPVELSALEDPAPGDFLIIHTVQPHPGLIDGRHITIATSQCAYAAASVCYLRIIDTTDPASPVQVGTWTLPDAHHGNGLTTEIFALRDGLVYVPWGAAGMWVLDIGRNGTPEEPLLHAYHRLSEGTFANAAALNGDAIYLADPGSRAVHAMRLAP